VVRQVVLTIPSIIIILATAHAVKAEGDPEVGYRVFLSVDPESGIVKGEGEIAFTNSSSLPLERIPLILYPNRFREPDPRIRDVNFERYYSPVFNPGHMTIERATVLGEGECAVEQLDGLPAGTYAALRPKEPLAPGAKVTVRLRWEVLVPDRYGLFGRRDGRLLAEGGLWPMVAARDRSGAFAPALGPIRATHEVKVSSKSGTTFVARTTEARNVFVAAGANLEPVFRLEAHPNANAPEVVVRGTDADTARKVALLVQGAAQIFHRDWVPGVAGPIDVVVGAVRDRLAHPAGDVLLVSDRVYEVLPYLESFHEREITRATFELLGRRALLRVEEGDAPWVAEAIAWVAVEDWDRARQGLKGDDVRGGLGTFDFIEGVDTQLKAPQFTDSDLYFGRISEPRDAVRDELDRFGTARPRGRFVAEKLRDKFGTAALKKIVKSSGAPFRARASKVAQEDLTLFFDLWLGPPPKEKVTIESREVVTLPTGEEAVKIVVRRETDDPRLAQVGEPVTVRFASDGVVEQKTWDGKGERGELIFPRHGVIYSIDVDPEGRIDQDYRGDFVFPSIGKLLLNRFDVNIDLNGGNTSSVSLGFTFHPRHDYHQSILMDAFYSATAQGGRVGYAYHFGSPITDIQFAQTAFVSGVFEKVEPGLLRFAANKYKESDGTICAYTLGYSIDNREPAARQTHGFHAGAAVESAWSPYLGGDFTYEKVSANFAYLFSPVEPLTFAFLAAGGQVFGPNPPTQALFDAGGEDGVRGIPTGDFLDRAFFVVKGEVRLTVLEDLDLDIIKLGWIRRIELAGFTDAGQVAYEFGSIFRAPGKWLWGAGAGIRFEIDIAGVRPLLVRFDVAWRCDSGPGPDKGAPQFYLGVGQSF